MDISEHYVAYFDVLGYKEAFRKSEDVSVKLIQSIESSINLLKSFILICNKPSEDSEGEEIEIKYKVFSDNILICYKRLDNDEAPLSLLSFLRLIALIQRVFFEGYGIVVRGGVTKGPLYFSNEFVGGKALIDCVELESNAVFPRIVVDKIVLKDLQPGIQNEVFKNILDAGCSDLFIKLNDDSVCLNYIIVFDPWIMLPRDTPQPEKMESFEEILQAYQAGCICKPKYKPECLKEIFIVLRKHKMFVEKNVNEFRKSCNDLVAENQRLKILKKYLWLVSFHNKLCDEMYGMPELKIVVQSVFNEQTLAFDVSVG